MAALEAGQWFRDPLRYASCTDRAVRAMLADTEALPLARWCWASPSTWPAAAI